MGDGKAEMERRTGRNRVRKDWGLCILQSRAGEIQGGDRKEQGPEDRERTGELAKGDTEGQWAHWRQRC